MPYTSHGHWYGPGTPTQPGPRLITRCGAPGMCPECAADTRRMPAGSHPGPLDGQVFDVEHGPNGPRWAQERLNGNDQADHGTLVGEFTADPDKPCQHEAFETLAKVARIVPAEGQPPAAYVAEIQIKCRECGEPFQFVGVPAGLRYDQPMSNVDGTELRAPIMPASTDPGTGPSLPGFSIRMT